MLRKYFWDCNFEDLTMAQYPIFISERILNLGDVGSLRWLFTEIDKEFLTNLVNKSRNLNKKTKNYWNLMLCQPENTLNGTVNDVQVSFFGYEYPLLDDLHRHMKISIAHMLDIALMKLEAISGRGSKKDFH